MTREMALVGKAHRNCNLRHGEIRLNQHIAGMFDPLLGDIVMRRDAGGLLKSSGEMMDR